jgi:hypothetical protein
VARYRSAGSGTPSIIYSRSVAWKSFATYSSVTRSFAPIRRSRGSTNGQPEQPKARRSRRALTTRAGEPYSIRGLRSSVGRLRAGGSRAGRTVSYPRATSLFDELQARIASRQWEEAISVGEKLLALAGIRAEEIRALSGFQPRLVIASACETGVIEGYEDADEALSLGSRSSLWAPTGVVSTLWAIDDWATMLLMSRFYELLRDANDPATALREAQLWLQLLRPEQEDAYLATRPLLGASREERQRRSRELRGGRDDANEEPYASLSTWAAFVFTGA